MVGRGGNIHSLAHSPPKRPVGVIGGGMKNNRRSPARSSNTGKTVRTGNKSDRSGRGMSTSEKPTGSYNTRGAASDSSSDAVNETGDRAESSDKPRGPPSLSRPSGADLLTMLADTGGLDGVVEETDSTRGMMRGRSSISAGERGDVRGAPSTPPGGNRDGVSGYKNLSRSERRRLLREVKQVLGEESVSSGHRSADESQRREDSSTRADATGRSGTRQLCHGGDDDDEEARGLRPSSGRSPARSASTASTDADGGSAVDTAFYTSATFETEFTKSEVDTAFYTQATDYTMATGATGYTTEYTEGDTAFYTEATLDADEEYRRHRYREKKSSRARLSACTSPDATATYDEDDSLLLVEEEEDFLDRAGACLSMLCGGGVADGDLPPKRKESPVPRNDDMSLSLDTTDTSASESRAVSQPPHAIKERLRQLAEESRRENNSSDDRSVSDGTGEDSRVQHLRDDSELAGVHKSASLSLAPSGFQETVEMTHSMVQRATTTGERSDGAVVPSPPPLAEETIERSESSGVPAASAIINETEAFWRGDGVWNADPSVFAASTVANEGAEAYESVFPRESSPGVGFWSDDCVWNADPSVLETSSGGQSGSSADPSLQTEKAAIAGTTNGPGGALQLNMDGTTAEFNASGAARASPVSSGIESANIVVAKPPSMQQTTPKDNEADLLGEEARHLSNVSRSSVLKRVSSIGMSISSRQRERRKGRDESSTVSPEKDSTSRASTKRSNSTKATKSTLSSSRDSSVNRSKKLRAWREYMDPRSGRLYYSNGITTVWERPADVEIVTLAHSASNHAGSHSQASRAKLEPPSTSKRSDETSSKDRPPLDGNPRRATRSKLRLFSFRKKKPSASQEGEAKRSADRRPEKARTPEPLAVGQSDKSKATGVPSSPARTEKTDSDASGSDSSMEGVHQQRAGTTRQWREYKDAATGKSYYSNGLETTWTMPPELVAESALAQMRLDTERGGEQREKQRYGPGQDETKTKRKKGGRRRWREFVDPRSGNSYYSDGVTTTWARPNDFLAAL